MIVRDFLQGDIMDTTTVICPGSFDPVTLGHIDIIKRASKMFDKVIVAVLVNMSKTPSFSIEERINFLTEALKEVENIEIVGFSGLLADYAKERGAKAVVKGLRAMSDFEYEFQMALTNKKLNPEIETVFIPARSENMFLSSSVIKQVCALGGDVTPFIPQEVSKEIIDKLMKG